MVNVRDAAASRSPSPTRPTGLPKTAGIAQHGPLALPVTELQGLALRRPAPAGGPLAPRATLPAPVSGSAETASASTPMPQEALSPRSAKQRQNELIVAMRGRHDAVFTTDTPEQKQQAMERFVEAAGQALNFYAGLPRDLATHALEDAQVIEIYEEAMRASGNAAKLAAAAYEALLDKQRQASDLLASLIRASEGRGEPLNLPLLLTHQAKLRAQDVDFWDRKARRAEQTAEMTETVARLPTLSPESRPQCERQYHTFVADALVARFSGLQRLTEAIKAEARWSAAELKADDADEAAASRLELARHLDAFQKDLLPTYESTLDAAHGTDAGPLSKDSVQVLEGLLGRLAELASLVDEATAGLRSGAQAGSASLLAMLDRAVESTWITADAVTKLLQTRPREEPASAPLALAEPAATPATQRPRKRNKGKRKQQEPAPAPAPREPAAASAAPAKVLGRSEFGTPQLVDAKPAAAGTSSSSGAVAAASAVAASQPSLEQQLQRLDELLDFNLGAQLRTLSQARREREPEAAKHVAETTIERLSTLASEMEACHKALNDQRRALGSKLPAVHDKLGGLKVLLADVRGQAEALQRDLPTAVLDHMKTYRFPTQAHIEHLREHGALATVGGPQPLKGEPGKLFELQLQPAPLRNSTVPKPVWLHIHTRKPVRADELARLDDAAFAATHLKSDEERGRNREWQDAQARAGHDNALIYRGKVTPALCKSLLGAPTA